MSRPAAPTQPVMSVPAIVYPPDQVKHDEVIGIVRELYAPLCELHPGDAEYRRGFADVVEGALRMAGHLGIDVHPIAVPVGLLTTPRGLKQRNAEAVAAFRQYVPPTARQALGRAGVSAQDIDAVLVETSTVYAMPSVAYDVISLLGLRTTTEVIPVHFMGCNGGAHAVARARDYLLAHPDHKLLIIAADFASPHFHVEPDLRDGELRGSIISSALFADAAAAAVMAAELDAPGFRMVGTGSVWVPRTEKALAFAYDDDGPHFMLTDGAMRCVPQVTPYLVGALAAQGWTASDLAVCSMHSGGDRIINDVIRELGLTEHHVEPTRLSLRYGNTMSVACFAALANIFDHDHLRPAHGGRGMGAGFGPGFACTYFLWTVHNVGQAVGRKDYARHRRPVAVPV